jgi:streptomycin 6-kinase
MVDIPDRLKAKSSHDIQRREWLATLPEICRRLSIEWSVDLGAAFEQSHVSLVVTAEHSSAEAVLKVPMPEEVDLGTLAADARSNEARALGIWAGNGAVRLLERDASSGAMLLDRCVPGEALENIRDGLETDRVATALLQRLHEPRPDADGFERLSDRAVRLAETVAIRNEKSGARIDQWLVDTAIDLLTELSTSGPDDVLLHGDLHHHNILSSYREPWLAIDPLPMLGDPAYDVVQYLLFRKGDLADPELKWGLVIKQLSSGLGVDAERVKAWLFARLVSDAVAAHTKEGKTIASLEARQSDLWSARLVHRLRD